MKQASQAHSAFYPLIFTNLGRNKMWEQHSTNQSSTQTYIPQLKKKSLYCMIPSSRDNLCHHNNALIFETIGSCICCRLAMLMPNTQLQTNTADFSQAWLNITNSYLGIIATLPVFPQPSSWFSTPLSPLSPALVYRPKWGSKNSGELNSHNNMRLSGDRGSNVCVPDSMRAATGDS